MTRLVVSRLAQSDTTFIVSGLAAKAGNSIAARYAADFEALYERLLVHPESGPVRFAIGPRVRIGIVWPYIVVYEYDGIRDLVTILRVLHGRRKITGRFLLSDE
ncbi:type II toxin-antitoxin system RelE/ParE family toxin [Beijerinckia sp. L45]|uniref:type II toxin-antitoxin system RelE/ParE family toxin n=1 Tax=Beijerinckia sp. L45 TaxID=1641855 RepID=UPI00131DF358|nr:type II toxin-antitoxin system RelE/ParE family toxin [Beijerinckia sp. L45]